MSGRPGRLSRPSVVVLVSLAAAAVAAISGRRPWLSARVDDAVLGATTVSGTGTQVVPGLVALALILAAAVLAAATSGPVMRRVSLVVGGCVALGLGALAVRAATSAPDLLGAIAAEASSRTGSIPVTDAQVSAWPWLVVAASALAGAACLAGLRGAAGGRGLSQRYDAPAAADVPGPRGQRTPAPWDQLDHDVDPTDA